MFIGEDAGSTSDNIKDFYYTAVYDVLQEPEQNPAKVNNLKNQKAKLFV